MTKINEIKAIKLENSVEAFIKAQDMLQLDVLTVKNNKVLIEKNDKVYTTDYDNYIVKDAVGDGIHIVDEDTYEKLYKTA